MVNILAFRRLNCISKRPKNSITTWKKALKKEKEFNYCGFSSLN